MIVAANAMLLKRLHLPAAPAFNELVGAATS